MTFAISVMSVNKRRSAFTLVELLVVIGIIIVLIGFLLPMVFKALNQSKRVRVSSDLNAISAALEVYKQAFGDYPRVIYTAATTAGFTGVGSGAETLGKALMGLGDQPVLVSNATPPYSATTIYYAGQIVWTSGTTQYAATKRTVGNSPAANSDFWIPVSIPVNSDGTGGGFDGADGPGFRVRQGGYGDKFGPYLDPDKFKTRGLALIDYFGNPILYFPANPAKPAVTASITYTVGTTPYAYGAGGAYVGVATSYVPGGTFPAAVGVPCPSLYNYSDGDILALKVKTGDSNFKPAFPDTSAAGNGIKVMEAMLGNYSLTGYIDGTKGEVPATTASFLLWSAGPDGFFGPATATQDTPTFVAPSTTDAQRKNFVNKCDDVTNFSFGQ